MRIVTPLSRPVDRVRHAHRRRTARARLCAELEQYRTKAERAELEAILSRATDAERAELAACTGRTDWT